MATQVTLNSGSVDSAGSLALKTNGTTTAVTIDTSQNVGIGTASPNASYKMSITGNSASIYSGILFTDTNAGGGVFSIYGESAALKFRDSSAGATRMVIDSSGNLGIGTSSPAQKLNVSGSGSVYGLITNTGTGPSNLFLGAANAQTQVISRDATTGAVPTVFLQGTTESMRIDSSGNLLVGKTAQSPTTAGIEFVSPTVGGSGITVTSAQSTNLYSGFQMYSTGAAAYRFYVTFDGKINATNTTIAGISDQRLKENIRDLDDGLNTVMALKPRKFDWKEGKGADIKDARGFIAQEFEEVFPDLIDEWRDPAPEGEDPYKSVRADLIPVLVKAIQEQQAIITSLTDRITALEAK